MLNYLNTRLLYSEGPLNKQWVSSNVMEVTNDIIEQTIAVVYFMEVINHKIGQTVFVE